MDSLVCFGSAFKINKTILQSFLTLNHYPEGEKEWGKNMKATLPKHLQITAAKFYFFQKVCLVWDHLLPQGTSWEIYVLVFIPKNFLPTTSTSTQGRDIGMFCPKGYGSSALLVKTTCSVLILAILVTNSVWCLHSSLQLGTGYDF